MIIDGKQIARTIIDDLKPKLSALAEKKFFGAALVGDDPASLHFLKQKEKVAQELDVDFRLYTLPKEITTDELRQEIGRLAGAKNCGGFIIQLPLQEKINKHYALNAIPKEKDVDVLSEGALGGFYTSRNPVVPPSVATVAHLLSLQNLELRNLKVVLIGAGFLIGRPVGFWLQNRVGELTVLDEHVKNLHERLHDADIVISGAGHPHLFSSKDLKSGTLVIDFGFSRIDDKTCGDFDPAGSEDKNISYTPTPGGTGPILVAKLFENFYLLNKNSS